MEAGTTLTGQWWTDRPTAAAPALASLARMVNDRTSSSGRTWLLPLAPWLMIDSADPAGGDAVTSVLRAAAQRHGLHGADRALRTATADRSWRHRYRAWRARRLLITTLADGPEGDLIVRDILLDGLNAVRDLEGLPPVPRPQTPVEMRELPVLVYQHAPDGSESLHYHASALFDRWPAPLIDAWVTRVAERSDPDRKPGPVISG